MAGIRVNTPIGSDWDYSLSLTSPVWQPSPVFLTQADGSAFTIGTTYPVYCRHTKLSLIVVNSIIFGLKSSEATLPTTLDTALQNGANSQIVPFFEGGLAAVLPSEPDGSSFPVVVLGPDGTLYVRGISLLPPSLTVVSVDDLFELVADTIVSLPNFILRLDINNCGASASTHGEIRGWAVNTNDLNTLVQVRIEVDGRVIATVTANEDRTDVRDNFLIPGGYVTQNTAFGWSFQKTALFSDGVEHDWQAYGGTSSVRATTDLATPFKITCGTVTPTKTITQQVFRGPIAFLEGTSGTARIVNLWSDGSETPYTDNGAFSLLTPYPNGVTFTNSIPGQTTITVPPNSLVNNVAGVLRFNFPDGRVLAQDITYINSVNLAPAIDVLVTPTTGGYTADFRFRAPSDYQYQIDYVGHFNGTMSNLIPVSNPDALGYGYGHSIGPLSVGDVLHLTLRPTSGADIVVSLTITGTLSRTTLYAAPAN